MKKNFKTIATAGLLVGLLTIGGVGGVALASGNPYQNFRNAAINTASTSNLTVNADVRVTQNGVEILSENVVNQMNRENGRRGGRGSRNKAAELASSPNTIRLMEAVADLLVGDARNHFTSNGNTISVNLDGAQVPELVNLAVSSAMELSASRSNRTMRNGETPQSLPILQNAVVSRIHVTADVTNEIFSSGTVNIVFSGQDDDGNAQEIELTVNGTIQDAGTAAATVQ